MTDLATSPSVPEVMPWDTGGRRPLHLHLSFAVAANTNMTLSELPNDSGSGWLANIVFADDASTVELALGIGWVTEDELIAVAGRLINVLEQARENARTRKAEALAAAHEPAAVPA